MHEYSLTRRIVNLANRAAQENGAARVTKVRLVVGESSGIVPESVQLYFDQIAQGTPAQGAALNVRVVTPEMRCPVCQRNFVRPPFSFACPVCGALGNPTEIGSEFYVESVELEIAAPL
jgi:hydrogenase nickel incorporation protein HypA/HybF